MPLLNLAYEARRLRQAIRRHRQEPPARQCAQVVQSMQWHLLGKARIHTRAVARVVRVAAAHTQPRPHSIVRSRKEEAAQADGPLGMLESRASSGGSSRVVGRAAE